MLNWTGVFILLAVGGVLAAAASAMPFGGQASGSGPAPMACICHNLAGLSSDELRRRRQLLEGARYGDYEAIRTVFQMTQSYPDRDNLACWYLQTADYAIKAEFDEAWVVVTNAATEYGWHS